MIGNDRKRNRRNSIEPIGDTGVKRLPPTFDCRGRSATLTADGDQKFPVLGGKDQSMLPYGIAAGVVV
uniref:Uncharacterized protein n=1 Tax=Romanomermis culicivorax TaxID=13658 RepID=A0A915I2K3_ROMCU